MHKDTQNPSRQHVQAQADLYCTERGCEEKNTFFIIYFLFPRFHLTPSNHKTQTTAFLSLLPSCDSCLSISYLPTHGSSNVRPGGAASPLLLMDYSLLLSKKQPSLSQNGRHREKPSPAQSGEWFSQHLWRAGN